MINIKPLSLTHGLPSSFSIFSQIVKNLCRGGYACRQRVLRWFAEVLSSNELRAKMGHVLRITQQQAAESLDPMHSMLLSKFSSLLSGVRTPKPYVFLLEKSTGSE